MKTNIYIRHLLLVTMLLYCSCGRHKSQTSTQNITSSDSSLSDQQYVNRFKSWIRDTMKVLQPAVSPLTNHKGTVIRKIDIWDDSSQLLITDYYSFVYQKQDSIYQSGDDETLIKLLKQYKEEPVVGAKISFIAATEFIRSFVPQNRYGFDWYLDSIYIIDPASKAKTNYFYTKGKLTTKTKVYHRGTELYEEFYNINMIGDSVSTRLVKTKNLQ